MKNLHRAFALVALLSCSSASAQTTHNWLAAGGSEDGVVFFDSFSITNEGSVTTVWMDSVFRAPGKADGGAYAVSYLEQAFFNCGTKTYQTGYGAAYDIGGAMLESTNTMSQIQPVAPGTVMESLEGEVCKKRDPVDDAKNGFPDMLAAVAPTQKFMEQKTNPQNRTAGAPPNTY